MIALDIGFFDFFFLTKLMFRHHFHYIEDFIKKKNMGPNQIHGKIIAHIIKKKLL